MKFSIIVPTYNAEKFIKNCLNSIVDQLPGNYAKEALFIDDCSTDNTYQLLYKFRENNKGWINIFKNNKNLGPGPSRNVGIENASGEWLIFLDCDDALNINALNQLSEYINNIDSFDIVGYDWANDRDSKIKNAKYGGRWDLSSLMKNKEELMKDYLSLGMDCSVIYTAMRKSFIDAYGLIFRDGLHEDVDFLFKVYFSANKKGVLNLPLYIKNNRKSSIVNSISEEHIKGFSHALKEIYLFLNSQKMLTEEIKAYCYYGLLRMISTEIIRIWQRYGSDDFADKLYFMLHNEYLELLNLYGFFRSFQKHSFQPKYIIIAKYFLDLVANKRISIAKDLANYLEGIMEKSWSCYDLHNSIFLAPDEIRTCCKRFFVNNKMKGDVALLTERKNPLHTFTPENILKEKRNLYVRINRGIAGECAGCPYLEFKKWEPIDKLEIQYISFEYNTICNMRCCYCDEKYFGGKKAKYNVELLLEQLFEKGCLQSCNTFMWGGGEPTLNKSFGRLISYMTSKYPIIRQRIFTNATEYSEGINRLLQEDKVITITSIDAGCEEIFYKIRKHKGLNSVLSNLKKYSSSNQGNMIIKYIITKHNRSLSELQNFVKRMREYSLERCNYQISFDFKEELVDPESLISAIALFTFLSDINARFIFYDDLFWQRISDELNARYDVTLNRLKELNLFRAFATPEKHRNIVIWGAGIQARFLIEKSVFLKKTKIEYFVDNSAEKIGKNYLGYKVLSPETLLESNFSVLIAAVQNTPNILGNYFNLGLSESRLIKELVF